MVDVPQSLNSNSVPYGLWDDMPVAQSPNNVPFKVTKENDVFRYHSLAKKIGRVAYLIFSIIFIPLGLCRLIGRAINKKVTPNAILPSMIMPWAPLNFDLKPRCIHSTIQTTDGVNLDTMLHANPSQEVENIPVENRKCILFFNGNGSTYEGMYDFLETLSEETTADIYSGNYRGVGASEGFATGYQDLVMDGEAMVQHLLSLGYKEENILIHGWSLGAGVGAHVAALHQEEGRAIHYCSDRSFASLATEVKHLVQRDKQELRARGHTFLAKLVKIASKIAEGLVKLIGWNFQSLTCYKKLKGHKFIVFHRQDQLIKYEASLFKQLKDAAMTKEDIRLKKMRKKGSLMRVGNRYDRTYRPENVIVLTKTYGNAHDRRLDEFDEGFAEYKQQVNKAFNRVPAEAAVV